jgi:hypothetical protein
MNHRRQTFLFDYRFLSFDFRFGSKLFFPLRIRFWSPTHIQLGRKNAFDTLARQDAALLPVAAAGAALPTDDGFLDRLVTKS